MLLASVAVSMNVFWTNASENDDETAQSSIFELELIFAPETLFLNKFWCTTFNS